MLEHIEKLLVLQDRDRKIRKLREELAHIPHERGQHEQKLSSSAAGVEQAKAKLKHAEADRKRLEMEAEAKRQQIEKYALQQYQTKRNEEYRALAHEIENCKKEITTLEDQQLELMEQAETLQKEIARLTQTGAEAKAVIDSRLKDLAAREQNLKKDLAELEAGRAELASQTDDTARSRYERLLRHKGDNVVVGIDRGVCGGCHMQLNRQVVVHCRGEQELITCPNCGRILYYTPDMDVAVVE